VNQYAVLSDLGIREWWADDAEHAAEQHRDAFPDEPILAIMPPLPEAGEDEEEMVTLVLFRQNQPATPIAEDIDRHDAMEYCEREDTHGDGWFIGWWYQ
jgi:hypothetical protein